MSDYPSSFVAIDYDAEARDGTPAPDMVCAFPTLDLAKEAVEDYCEAHYHRYRLEDEHEIVLEEWCGTDIASGWRYNTRTGWRNYDDI